MLLLCIEIESDNLNERLMTSAMFVWICVAAIMAGIILVRLLSATMRKHHRFVELGSEREEIWIPGDRPVPARLKDEAEWDDGCDD